MESKEKKKKKTKLETVLIPRAKEIIELLDKGVSEQKLAEEYLGISYTSWRSYKKAFFEYMEAKDISEQSRLKDVEQAMYEAAIGITKLVRKAMKLKTVTYKDGKRLKEEERIEYYTEEVFVPPSVSAGQFLLKNWDKAHYSNNPAELEQKKEEFDYKKEKEDW